MKEKQGEDDSLLKTESLIVVEDQQASDAGFPEQDSGAQIADDTIVCTNKVEAPDSTSSTDSELRDPLQPEDPLVGTVLVDRYRILGLIGKGATSSVYKAADKKLEREVAVKVLHSHLVSDKEVFRRFEQEVKTSSVLAHPNAITIHDSGVARTGQPFLVMEYAEGQTLTEMIKQGGGLEPKRAIKVFLQICACLAAAHEKGIVHRDLKPGNIIVSAMKDGSEFVRVLDFGIAKIMPVQGETFMRLTQSGETLGSLLYMSPEQCLDEDLDARSDIYSLGCLMYETLTGKPPLSGRTAFETMNKQMSSIPVKFAKVRPDLNLPGELEAIVFQALSKNPKNRFQTAGDLSDDLCAVLSGAPVIHQNQLLSHHNQLSEEVGLDRGRQAAGESGMPVQPLTNFTEVDPKAKALLMEELEPGETIIWTGAQKFASPSWVKNFQIGVPVAVAITILLSLLFPESSLFIMSFLGVMIFVFGGVLPCMVHWAEMETTKSTLLCFTNRRFLQIALNIPVHSDGAARVQKPEKTRVLSIEYASTKSLKILEERESVGKLAFIAKTRFAGTGQTDDSEFAVDHVPNPAEVCQALSSYLSRE